MNAMTVELEPLEKWTLFAFDSGPPWMRRDGVRIMATCPQYGVREDGVGKLIPLPKDALVFGRDEHRMSKFLLAEAKRLSDELAEYMRVDRRDVRGRKKRLSGRFVRRRECRFIVAGETIIKPLAFVTYLTPKGRVKFFRLDVLAPTPSP
jgi:hypothetical protein